MASLPQTAPAHRLTAQRNARARAERHRLRNRRELAELVRSIDRPHALLAAWKHHAYAGAAAAHALRGYADAVLAPDPALTRRDADLRALARLTPTPAVAASALLRRGAQAPTAGSAS